MKLGVAFSLGCVILVSVLYAKLPLSRILIPKDANSAVLVTVGHVVDGDRLVLADGEPIGLTGVEAPNLHDKSYPVEYFAQESKSFVEQLIKGHEIKLAIEKGNRSEKGCLMGYVYLADGNLLNAELVKQGFGFASTTYPCEFASEFGLYEKQAHDADLGLWNNDGVSELRWIKEQKRKPFEIYCTSNNQWAIEYLGMAMTHLTLEALNNELSFLRKSAYVRNPEAIESQCLRRGWHKTEAKK